MSKPKEYLCQIDDGVIPTITTNWTLKSPDNTVWGVTISTNGILTVTSGVTEVLPYHALSIYGFNWLLTISNAGIITITETADELSASDTVIALTDSDSITWLFVVGRDGQLRVTTEEFLNNHYYYPSIIISFITSAATDQFELHAVKPNTSMHRR